MPNLILIKHSLPEIIPDLPAREWHLSDEGRRRCENLAEAVVHYQPQVIITSLEPKAVETGQYLSVALQIPIDSMPDLHEHERRKIMFVSQERFEADVRPFFEHPGQRVMGEESADEAYARFSAAVWGVVNSYPGQNIAVVAHGTVISLFVAHLTNTNPFPLWKRLGLPSFVVLALPQNQVIALENIAA